MKCQNILSHVIRQGDNLYQLAQYYQTSVPAIVALNPHISPYNMIVGSSITICPGKHFNMPEHTNPPACSDPAIQFAFMSNMREAWIQHVYWTRMLLISIDERLQDQQYVTERLLENPEDIASIFANYYSSEAANQIQQLLTEHLQIGAELITALRDGETEEADELTRQWYENANQMADAFSSINPYYDREEMRTMLYEHLNLTTEEVKKRLAGDYPGDIEAFDLVEAEALSMADYFSQGIMKQFPQYFL